MLRLMVMRAPAVALLVLLAACGGSDAYTGTWTGPDGQAADRGESREFTYEVWSRVGPEHCDWDSVVFLSVGWPLGTTQGIGLPNSDRQYIRDPDDVLDLGDRLESDVSLPEGSASTGYSTDGIELWFGPDEGDRYACLVRDADDVERWPRAVEPPACY